MLLSQWSALLLAANPGLIAMLGTDPVPNGAWQHESTGVVEHAVLGKPGEKFRVEARWADSNGKVTVDVYTGHLPEDDHDIDDATHVTKFRAGPAKGLVGKQVAVSKVGNAIWFRIEPLSGDSSKLLEFRVTRVP